MPYYILRLTDKNYSAIENDGCVKWKNLFDISIPQLFNPQKTKLNLSEGEEVLILELREKEMREFRPLASEWIDRDPKAPVPPAEPSQYISSLVYRRSDLSVDILNHAALFTPVGLNVGKFQPLFKKVARRQEKPIAREAKKLPVSNVGVPVQPAEPKPVRPREAKKLSPLQILYSHRAASLNAPKDSVVNFLPIQQTEKMYFYVTPDDTIAILAEDDYRSLLEESCKEAGKKESDPAISQLTFRDPLLTHTVAFGNVYQIKVLDAEEYLKFDAVRQHYEIASSPTHANAAEREKIVNELAEKAARSSLLIDSSNPPDPSSLPHSEFKQAPSAPLAPSASFFASAPHAREIHQAIPQPSAPAALPSFAVAALPFRAQQHAAPADDEVSLSLPFPDEKKEGKTSRQYATPPDYVAALSLPLPNKKKEEETLRTFWDHFKDVLCDEASGRGRPFYRFNFKNEIKAIAWSSFICDKLRGLGEQLDRDKVGAKKIEPNCATPFYQFSLTPEQFQLIRTLVESYQQPVSRYKEFTLTSNLGKKNPSSAAAPPPYNPASLSPSSSQKGR